jgi:glycopeptide antibiotics resistance protein
MAEPRLQNARRVAPLRRLGNVGLLLAVPVVLLITLWPNHFFMRAKPRVVQGLEWLHAQQLFEWLYWTRLEVLANVAMLVPVAMLLTFVLGARRGWLAVAMCVAASVGVELVQYVMPGRVSSIVDVVANGLGAVIGALLAVAIEAMVVRGRRAAARRSARRWMAANG